MSIGAGEFEFSDHDRALAPLWEIPSAARFKGDWFPLHFDRLLNSEFMTAVDDSAKFVAVMLWARSLRQTPVATLPADHGALARLAEFGRDVAAWRRVAPGALYGWRLVRVDHEDGEIYRLGHGFVAGVAQEALGLMGAAAERAASGRDSKSRGRLIEQLRRLGCVASECNSAEFVAAVEAELSAAGAPRRTDAAMLRAIEAAGRALASGVVPIGKRRSL